MTGTPNPTSLATDCALQVLQKNFLIEVYLDGWVDAVTRIFRQDTVMNQSQKSLLENLCQGNHEASDGQKSDVGVSVPVIPGYQSPPVV